MVKTGQPLVSRPEWYDRNPSRQAQYYYGAGVGPHALTTRWTYTAASDKKAWLEQMQMLCIRYVAATTLGDVYLELTYTPSGGSLQIIMLLYFRNNTAYATDRIIQGLACMLGPGDVLAFKTYDGSTGGNLDYYGSCKITDFDV